ncbi:MAG: PepSY domain-containing protein [Sphingorhabdus sp.]|uniref:PepSY domain-containing protein n=1 Tax=Sphingorhabdus sp. TaxID=1902408 RepID=UPI003C938EF5
MKYPTLHKWHVWLGWLVGVPLILWTASGLFMVARPIEEVRGEHLRAKPTPIATITPTAPYLGGRTVEKLTLEQRASGPVWIIRYTDGGERRADPATGKLLPKPGAAEIRALAEGYYAGDSKIASIRLFPADREPKELRRGRPAWQVALADGANLYIDADSGSLLAVRTQQWRWFDFMWGLHIMDLQTREDTSHPILIGFAGLSLISLLMAFWLLIARQRRKAAAHAR